MKIFRVWLNEQILLLFITQNCGSVSVLGFVLAACLQSFCLIQLESIFTLQIQTNPSHHMWADSVTPWLVQYLPVIKILHKP